MRREDGREEWREEWREKWREDGREDRREDEEGGQEGGVMAAREAAMVVPTRLSLRLVQVSSANFILLSSSASGLQ